MKYTIALIALLSYATFAQDSSPQLSVEEIFSVQTSEELEAALTDGYPMPWLAEILEDETIPEEDRYWLDCRVRAVIARDLHLFFSRDGEPIHVEAEGGIRNGESYWREIFIVEPGRIDRQMDEYGNVDPPYEPPYHFIRTPGYLMNRFGERIGEIATTDIKIHLSRDGLNGMLVRQFSNPSQVLFLNSNSEVTDIVIGPALSGSSSISISDDGSMALVACEGTGSSWTKNLENGLGIDYPPDEVTLHVFSGTGTLLYTRNLLDKPTYIPTISPDNKFIAYACSEETFLLNAETGETIFCWNIYGPLYPYFTQNSRYLCIPAVGRAKIFDCYTGEIAFEMPEGEIPLRDYHRGLSVSNNLSVFAGERILRPPNTDAQFFSEIFLNGQLYSSELMNSYFTQNVSPNGFFIDRQNYSPFRGGLNRGGSVPYTLLQVGRRI